MCPHHVDVRHGGAFMLKAPSGFCCMYPNFSVLLHIWLDVVHTLLRHSINSGIKKLCYMLN